MKKRSPRGKRQLRNRILAIGLTVLVLAAIAGGAILFVSAGESRELGTDMCPTDGKLDGYWAVLIDATDHYNSTQRAWIKKQFEAVKDSIPQYGQLAIFTVTESAEDASRPIISRCNPGTGEGVSSLTANPELLWRRWEDEFDQPLSDILTSLLQSPASDSSPIMETIQRMNIDSGLLNATSRHLVVFSDLMQHSENYSHYVDQEGRFAAFTSSESFRKVRTDLAGWDVVIFYARRDDPIARKVQGRSHIDFWDRYFSSMDGRVSRVKWIEG